MQKRLTAGKSIAVIREVGDRNTMDAIADEVRNCEVGDNIKVFNQPAVVLGENVVAVKSVGYDLIVFGMTPGGKSLSVSLDKALIANIKKYL